MRAWREWAPEELTGKAGASSFVSVNEEDESDPDRTGGRMPHSQRAALVGLSICLVLVLGGLFLVYELKKMSELQDCVMQGRTNCAPIDTSD